MSDRGLLMIGLLLAALAAPGGAEEARKPVRAVSVHVYAVEQVSPESGAAPSLALLDAAAELRRKIQSRKGRFQLVEGRGQAEAVVALLSHHRDTTTRETADGTETVDRHRLQARLLLGSGGSTVEDVLRTGEGGSLTAAADRLLKELEELCRKHYWKPKVR